MIDLEQNEGRMSQEEMSANLDNSFREAESAYRDMISTDIMVKNSNRGKKRGIMNYIFDILEANGLNPSDQKSLSDFMEKAKKEDPEIYRIIEESLTSLLELAERQEEDEPVIEEQETLPIEEGMMPQEGVIPPSPEEQQILG